jgi:hypothetical protein
VPCIRVRSSTLQIIFNFITHMLEAEGSLKAPHMVHSTRTVS